MTHAAGRVSIKEDASRSMGKTVSIIETREEGWAEEEEIPGLRIWYISMWRPSACRDFFQLLEPA